MRPSTRLWLGLLVLAIPAAVFLPGLGLESSHPSALARRSGEPEPWLYRVQRGDQLGRIAERELGTFRRYPEILALNPGVEPRRLAPGTVLRMPPRTPPRAEAGAEAPPVVAAPPAADSRGLILSFAGLLGALVLVILAAGRLERRGDGA